MSPFLIFIKKEWLHIWRDKRTLLILFGMPIMQIVIFGFALSNEVKNSKIAIIDPSHDEITSKIIQKIESSRYFDVQSEIKNQGEMLDAFHKGKIKMAIVFDANFADNLQHSNSGKVQLIADGTDPNTATTLQNYSAAIINDFQTNYFHQEKMPYSITTEIRMLYNPQLQSAYNFVPGVMAMILLLVCTMMTSIAIVKEKETGTMEVLLVSPLKPLTVIISKAIPYLFLSMVNVASILLLSVYALDLPIRGSLPLLVGESALFTLTALSLGLLISSVTASQQVAMLISLMGMFMPTLMFSGFMFPIENMPVPLQVISNIIPAKWFFIIVKNVMIKGIGFEHVWKESLILLGMTIFLIALSVKKYKIRLDG